VNARQTSVAYGYYGIVFGVTDFGYCYGFLVDPIACKYAIWSYTGQGNQMLVDWTWSEYILTLLGTNHLRVERNAEQITVAVNDHPLTTISDGGLQGSLRVGVLAGTWPTTETGSRLDSVWIQADARFDDFCVWVPAGATPVPSPTPTPTRRPTSPLVYGRSADGLLELNEWDYRIKKYGGLSIVGTVVSRSHLRYSYVEISFNLYDKTGAQVGNAWSNVTNLDPLGTWRFEALVLEDGVDRAEFAALRGW
jgi:hypothetical protein